MKEQKEEEEEEEETEEKEEEQEEEEEEQQQEIFLWISDLTKLPQVPEKARESYREFQGLAPN